MPAITTNDLKNGMTLNLDDGLFQVVEFQHVKPGKGGAFVRTTLKNVRNGAVVDRTFRGGERVERAMIDKREMQFLYREGDDYVFMDNTSYEQLNVGPAALGDAANYLVEGSGAVLEMYEDEIVGVELPAAVELSDHRDRAGRAGRPGVGRPQAGHARDGPGGAGAAVRGAGRADQGRHAQRRVPDPGVSPTRGPATREASAAGARPASGRWRCSTSARASRSRPAEVIAALPVPAEPFAVELVEGVGEHLDEIDDTIRRYAKDWTLERMPAIDRAVLRIGVFELVHRPDVPDRARSSPRRSSWPRRSAPTTRGGS